MIYFKNVKSVEELKTTYKKLARQNHPDFGGDVEAMKIINNEFDMLCHVLPEKDREECYTTRSEFYTQNGWKGSNYDSNLSLKEIAVKVRNFCKEMYPECKFSVTTEYASMCQELHVSLMESPYRCNKTVDELTEEEMYDGHYSFCYQYGHETDSRQKEAFLRNYYTTELTKIMKDVDRYVNSFNYSDCDGMIDYFDVNFYYFNCNVGKWNKPYVQNESRLSKKRKVLAEI